MCVHGWRHSMRFKSLLILLSIGSAPSAWAQDPDDIRDPVITVVATGSARPIDDSGQSLSVITADEIDAIQGPDLTRALERAPGVTLSRNGGLGSFTGVRVRGSASEQVLVLVDGVRVADAAAPGGGFDFGTLTSGEIGRIELLRGSNSVIWGSDALGGVLALTTQAPEGVEASVEYGARDSFAGQVHWGLSTSAH